MKTKVVQHVPRINISMSQTHSHRYSWFPAFVMLTFFYYLISQWKVPMIFKKRCNLTSTNQSSRIVSCCSDWSKSIMTHRGTTIHGTPTRQGTTIHGTPTRQGTMFCRYPDASGNYNSRFPDASGYLVLRFPDASGNLVFLIIIGTLH